MDRQKRLSSTGPVGSNTKINSSRLDLREIGIKLKRLKVCASDCTVHSSIETPGCSLVACRVCDRYFHPRCTDVADGSSKFCHDCQVAFNGMSLLAQRHREQAANFAALRLEHEQLKQQLNTIVAATRSMQQLPLADGIAVNPMLSLPLLSNPAVVKQEWTLPTTLLGQTGTDVSAPVPTAHATARKRVESNLNTRAAASPASSSTSSMSVGASGEHPAPSPTLTRPGPAFSPSRSGVSCTSLRAPTVRDGCFLNTASPTVVLRRCPGESPAFANFDNGVTCIKRIFGGPRSMSTVRSLNDVRESDELLYCDPCGAEYCGVCPTHGPMPRMADSIVQADDPEKARHSLPAGLAIRVSSLPNAGLGVFADIDVDKGIMFGPYQGRQLQIDSSEAQASDYCWEITNGGKPSHCIDGSDVATSNWMRYVNCANNYHMQNLQAFQYKGHLFYRTIKNICAGSELLVWYGEAYSKVLGLDSGRTGAPVEHDGSPTNTTPTVSPRVDSPIATSLEARSLDRVMFLSKDCGVTASANERRLPIIDHSTSLVRSKRRAAFECAHCPMSFVSNVLLRRHILTNHRKIRRRLPNEPPPATTTTSNAEPDDQDSSSMKLRMSKCSNCGERFSSMWKLRRHQEEKHPGLKCKHCGKCFTRLGYLKRHVEIKHPEYKCERCGRCFTKAGFLRRHMNAKHPGFQCQRCSRCFSSVGDLRRHLALNCVAAEQPKFVCVQCDKCYASEGFLKRHAITTHGFLSCEVCEKRFMTIHYLRKHRMTEHSASVAVKMEPEEKSEQSEGFQCKFCHIMFASKVSRTRHLSRRHAFKCGICQERHSKKGRCTGCRPPSPSEENDDRADVEKPVDSRDIHQLVADSQIVVKDCDKIFLSSVVCLQRMTAAQLPVTPPQLDEESDKPDNFQAPPRRKRGRSKSAKQDVSQTAQFQPNEESDQPEKIHSTPRKKRSPRVTWVLLEVPQTVREGDVGATAEESQVQSNLAKSSRNRPTRHHCYRCNLRFADSKLLADHQLEVHQEKVSYTCLECQRTFDYFEDVRDHQAEELHRGIDRRDVEVAPGPSPSTRLRQSVAELADSEDCNEGHEETPDPGDVTEEDYVPPPAARISPKEDPYKCSMCTRTFSLLRNLQLHQEFTHNHWSIHSCLACNLEFSSDVKLRKHQSQSSHVGSSVAVVRRVPKNPSDETAANPLEEQATTVVESSRESEECGQPAGTSWLEAEEEEQSAEPGPYECLDCTSTFSTSANLSRHQIRTHKERLTYSCAVCSKKFIGFDAQTELERHQRERKHVGAGITIQGPAKSSLSKEPLTENGDESGTGSQVGGAVEKEKLPKKPFIRKYRKCPQCEHRFQRIDRWREHQVKMHNMRIVHTCTFCKMQFYDVEELLDHQFDLGHDGKTVTLDGPQPPDHVGVKIFKEEGGRTKAQTIGLAKKKKDRKDRADGCRQQIYICLDCKWGFNDYETFKEHQSKNRHLGIANEIVRSEVDDAVDAIKGLNEQSPLPTSEAQADQLGDENVDALMALCQEVGISVGADGAATVTVQDVELIEEVVGCDSAPPKPSCFECSVCRGCYSSSSSLKTHVQSHGCTLVQQCLECRQDFTSHRALGKHLNIRGHRGSEMAILGADGQRFPINQPLLIKGIQADFDVAESLNVVNVAVSARPRRRGRPRSNKNDSASQETISSPSKSPATPVGSPKKNACHMCEKSFDKWERLRHHLLYTHDFVLINTRETLDTPSHDGGDTSVAASPPISVVEDGTAVASAINSEPEEEEVSLLCHLCGASSETYDEMKSHLESVHGVIILHSCPVCKEQFNSTQDLSRHQREWGHGKQMDSVAFVRVSHEASTEPHPSENLTDSQSSSADDGLIASVIGSDEQSDAKASTIESASSQTGCQIRPFSCQICGLATLDFLELKEHLQVIHSIGGVYTLCNTCHLHFNCYESVRSHQLESNHTGVSIVQLMDGEGEVAGDEPTVLQSEGDRLPLNKGEKCQTAEGEAMADGAEEPGSEQCLPVVQPKLTCPECGLTFDSATHLQEHQFNWHGMSVTNIASSKAQNDKAVSSGAYQLVSLSSEAEPETHECDLCNLCFKQMSDLREHQFYMHRLRTVYECRDCLKRSDTEEELLEHLVECEHKAGDAFLIGPDILPPAGTRETSDGAAMSSDTPDVVPKQQEVDPTDESFGFLAATLAEYHLPSPGQANRDEDIDKGDEVGDLIKDDGLADQNNETCNGGGGEDRFGTTDVLAESNILRPAETDDKDAAGRVGLSDCPFEGDSSGVGNDGVAAPADGKINQAVTCYDSDDEKRLVVDLNTPDVNHTIQLLPNADDAPAGTSGVAIVAVVNNAPDGTAAIDYHTWTVLHDHLYGEAAGSRLQEPIYLSLDSGIFELKMPVDDAQNIQGVEIAAASIDIDIE